MNTCPYCGIKEIKKITCGQPLCQKKRLNERMGFKNVRDRINELRRDKYGRERERLLELGIGRKRLQKSKFVPLLTLLRKKDLKTKLPFKRAVAGGENKLKRE